MIFLALKYLFSRPRQTVLTLLGIFLGTAAYVAISGFMLGFRGYLVDQLINNDAHVHIGAREEFLGTHFLDEEFYGRAYDHVFWRLPPAGRKDSDMVENPQQWYKRLDADPRVVAYSPQLATSVIFSNKTATASSTLTGVDALRQVRVTTIGKYVTEGKFEDLAGGGNRLVIGSELQKKLGAQISQNVMVAFADGPPTPFKIVGIFKTGNKLSDNVAYGALPDVQKVGHIPNRVNKIAVRLHDHSVASALANAWSKISPERVESWDQINASLFDVFRIQDGVRFMSVGAVMMVAGFGIYNVLNMTVMHKRKDIAILRSMGYEPAQIVLLFFFQGLTLGIVGTVLGLICGYLFGLYLQTIPFGGGPMGGGTGHLMFSFAPRIYVQSAMLGLLSATLASIMPAAAAGKMTPIQIIREGSE